MEDVRVQKPPVFMADELGIPCRLLSEALDFL